MKENVKFSILLPAFKAKFLLEAINSVLNQSYNALELIVVDDHSPEDIKKVCDSVHDSRLKYFRNSSNIGAKDVVRNWNKCLEYADGNYVICMGDDDRLIDGCLENCLRYIKANPSINVFHLHTQIIDERSNIVDVQEGRPAWESVYSATLHKLRGRTQFIGDWMFKTSELRNIGGFFYLPFAWYSDDITPLIVGKKTGIVNIPEFGFQYRVNSLTISSNNNNIEGKLEACRKAFCWYNNFYSVDNAEEDDAIYQKLILNLLPYAEKKAIILTLSSGMNNQRIRTLFCYLTNRKNLKVSIKTIFLSFVLSIKKSRSKSNSSK